jgi:hypothetical protein
VTAEREVHSFVAVEDTALAKVNRIHPVAGESIVHLGDILVVVESCLSTEVSVEGLVHIDPAVVLDHNLAAEEADPIDLAEADHSLPVVVDNLLRVVRHTLAVVVDSLEEGSLLVVGSLLAVGSLLEAENFLAVDPDCIDRQLDCTGPEAGHDLAGGILENCQHGNDVWPED